MAVRGTRGRDQFADQRVTKFWARRQVARVPGTRDPATTPFIVAGTTALAEMLPTATLLPVEGADHT